MIHVLEREQLVPRPRSEVFAFFSDAANLERLTPNSLKFRIKTPTPIEMKPGTLIDYEIKLSGVPMKWRTLIEVYEPETRFVDLQLKGPYKLWRHTHTFADAPGGTKMNDRVEYELPLGPLGSIAHAVFVKRQLKTIFDFRNEAMREIFPKV
ncbi:MAG TPA: SRPBCC family protein [Polyangiaceae bacterium]